MQEQITAALKKLGPSSPGQVADHLGVERTTIAPHIKKMLDDKTLKAAGVTKSRRLALPEQKFDEAETPAPPQSRKKHKKAKHGKKKHAARAPRATRTAAAKPAERFIPAVDAASRLIIVNGAEPHIFSEEQTEAIATLLYQHYKA